MGKLWKMETTRSMENQTKKPNLDQDGDKKEKD